VPDARLRECGNESGNGTEASVLLPCFLVPSVPANSLILLVLIECQGSALTN
jgi:hypothetical protein